jgi:18S rRNA (guanine1575-N7)-methyltransferase
MITSVAMKNGFTGGLIVDFPNSKKAKKYYLFLMAGYSEEIMKDAEKAIMLPKARTEGEGYSDDESSEDESMDEDDEDNSDEDSEDSEDMRKKGEAGEKQIGVTNKKRLNKTIQKAKKEIGRFKPNGNRKSKRWIMEKKAR